MDERKEDLLKAWKKICQWTKGNCKGKFPNGKRFKTPHNPYGWVAVVINSRGECAIYRGDHSSDCPTYVLTENGVYGFSHSITCGHIYGDNASDDDYMAAKVYSPNIIYDEIELVMREWRNIKSEILAEIMWSNQIKEFQP